MNKKITSKFMACVEAGRLSSFINDESLLPVYASSNAKILPYQIAAAHFALRSDYLKGCILCDEASLGKTYEALLVVGQKWYEGKENILIILPDNLLLQWFGKLQKDFPTLPYVFWNNSKVLPEEKGLVITTYDIALRHSETVKSRDWDIVVFDEADVLSNYEAKSVITLKEVVGEAFKLLLTPTPITLSIMDIYGLIHFIDEKVLPDADLFYKRYYNNPKLYQELTNWVSQYCFRTLKVQTTEYVNFTRRLPITLDYPLSKEEEFLYKLTDSYIHSENKAAYPEWDNYKLSLLFYKTLSSSPEAFIKMLEAPLKRSYGIEKEALEQLQKHASNIKINSKTTHLLKILKTVFAHLKSMKVNQKAIIFVENKITLWELYKIILSHGYNTLKYENSDTIEQFRNDKEVQILITTDDAAKGIDLEFCPVEVNYDFPYDAIKIEQRICRCHRQGQKSDVLVVNLLSKNNFFDVRILQLINKRTKQFNGIFGMSDDIVGNFDVKIKEVLKDFRHRDEVLKSFKENLAEHKESNEQIVENTENILFTTFTKSISDSVMIAPKYIEDKIDEINNDLWELTKFFFTENSDCYQINEENRTLTRIKLDKRKVYTQNGIIEDEVVPTWGYYTGSQHKYHQGREKYGMSKDLPYYERITYTSPLAKSIFQKYKWTYTSHNEIVYVDKEIEPCQIGYYDIDIVSKDGYQKEQKLLIGQNQNGEIISAEKCLEILKVPIIECKIIDSKQWRFTTYEFSNSGNLENKIPREQIIADYIKSREGSFAVEVENLKLIAGRKKSKLELDLHDIKAEIKALNKLLESKELNGLEELQTTKKLKILEKDLRKQEENLFFAQAQIDVETEKEIEELTEKSKFKVRTTPHFEIIVYPESKKEPETDKYCINL